MEKITKAEALRLLNGLYEEAERAKGTKDDDLDSVGDVLSKAAGVIYDRTDSDENYTHPFDEALEDDGLGTASDIEDDSGEYSQKELDFVNNHYGDYFVLEDPINEIPSMSEAAGILKTVIDDIKETVKA